MAGMPDRLTEMESSLAAVRERIASAARAAGRDPDDVTLVAVSKTWPASDVLALHRLGVADFGENRDAEAAAKAAALASAGVRPRWHFVGRLQRNKCRSVAWYADLVHSVDTPTLVTALAAGARRADRAVPVLVQVSDDGDPTRGGAAATDVPALADLVDAQPELRLRGVMVVAPLGVAPRPVFARLRELSERLRADHPDATIISAGMTADLIEAIGEGATHVRVGTALFGVRRPEVG